MNNEKKTVDVLIIDVWRNLEKQLDLKIENKGLEIRNVSITNNPVLRGQSYYDNSDDFEDGNSSLNAPKEDEHYYIISNKTNSKEPVISDETPVQTENNYHNIYLDFNVNIISNLKSLNSIN